MNTFIECCRLAFRNLYDLPAVPHQSLPDSHVADLITRARQHRVMGLLEAGYAISSRLPPGEASAWQRSVYGQALYTGQCTGEAEKIYRALHGRLKNPLIIKGPALAAQAWPDRGLRSFDDLDFRCRRNELSAAAQILSDLGYQPEIMQQRRMDHLWHFGWGVSFVGPNNLRVELNHRFFPPHYPWPKHVTMEHPQCKTPMLLDGETVQTLSAPVHLLLSCMHAVWHGWERMGWLVDIAGLLMRHPRAFSEADDLVAQDGFARRALFAGCGVAIRIFALESAKNTPVVEEQVFNTVTDILTRATPGVPLRIQRQCHDMFLSRREKLAYQLKRISIPGDGDFKALDLPVPLRQLYWISRPFRWLLQ